MVGRTKINELLAQTGLGLAATQAHRGAVGERAPVIAGNEAAQAP